MKQLEPGDKAPAFSLTDDAGNTFSLSALKGQNVVLYFYPEDDTPGCTAEACGFNDTLSAFKRLNAAVIGISKDTPASHKKFKDKYALGFTLVSDEDGKVCEAYGTWVEKSMYGRKYMGIDRATFLIDEKGKLAAVWRKVKVAGHVEEVKKAVQSLNKKAA